MYHFIGEIRNENNEKFEKISEYNISLQVRIAKEASTNLNIKLFIAAAKRLSQSLNNSNQQK